mgnify:FL=1
MPWAVTRIVFLEQWLGMANRDSEVLDMLPLTLANIGEEQMIHKVGGSPEVKKHLEDLGFVAGGTVTVVSSLNGNVIVKVKEARVAISEEMARRIMV